MKFAVIDRSGDVTAVYTEHRKAHEAYLEIGDLEWCVKPIMSLDEFNKTHTDYRGLTQGRPSVIYLDSETGATVLGYVYLIESWDAYQVWSGMKYKDYIVDKKEIGVMLIGEDDWGRKLYQNVVTGYIFVDVDGTLHTRSADYGEPDCPLSDNHKITYVVREVSDGKN